MESASSAPTGRSRTLGMSTRQQHQLTAQMVAAAARWQRASTPGRLTQHLLAGLRQMTQFSWPLIPKSNVWRRATSQETRTHIQHAQTVVTLFHSKAVNEPETRSPKPRKQSVRTTVTPRRNSTAKRRVIRLFTWRSATLDCAPTVAIPPPKKHAS